MSEGDLNFQGGSASYEAARKAHNNPGRKIVLWIVVGSGVLLGGLLAWALLFGSIFGIGITGEDLGEELVFSRRERIYYKHGTTEAQAKKLARLLEKEGIFTGSGQGDVVLAKESGTYIVSFAMVQGAWNDQETIAVYEALLPGLRDQVFDGKPVVIHLCDAIYRGQGTLGVKRVIQ